MSLQPILVAGQIQLVNIPGAARGRATAQVATEDIRRAQIQKRRWYYDGAQYDQENLDALSAMNGAGEEVANRLPEHYRKHAYSTQIQEAIDFLADEMADQFDVVAKDPQVQEVLDTAFAASVQLTGEGTGEDMAMDDVLRDALQAGDIACELVWDPIDESVRWDFWESEQVDFQSPNNRDVDRIVRTEVIWVPGVTETDEDQQVLETVIYDLAPSPQSPDQIAMECRRRVYVDEEEEPSQTDWLGISFLPWALLRAKKPLRGLRGESLISEQVMGHADRYNAVQQVGWLTARYNSHGNIAVVGDQAHLKLKDDQVLHRDIADVLSFPGGTAVTAISLPTDPAMLEEQRKVLGEAVFNAFGLVRVDPETVGNYAAVSGYALEILNRRTEGTFRKIRRNWIRDLRSLFEMTLDMHAERSLSPVLIEDQPVGGLDELPSPAFWTVNSHEVYPNREIAIRMGSGYIVDHIVTRDDYVALLISRKEALRRLGYKEDTIEKMDAEIKTETPPTPAAAVPGQAAPPTNRPRTPPFGNNGQGGSQQGTKAGSTVGTGG